MEFFDKAETKRVIETYINQNKFDDELFSKFSSTINHGDTSTLNEQDITKYAIKLIFTFMIKEAKEFDKYCTINIANNYDKFLVYLETASTVTDNQLLEFAFRYLYEFYLSCGYEFAHEYNDIISYIVKHSESLSKDHNSDFSYVIKMMPIYITKKLLNHEVIQKVSNVDSQVSHVDLVKEKIDNFEQTWDKNLEIRETKINALEAKLKNYEQGFNFVALYDGFKSLADTKNTELSKANFSVNLWIVVCSFLPVIGALSYYFTKDIYVNIPLASMLLLSIMFYRVAIINHKSIKSQILQLDLRKTLCQFIQDYAEYSEELKSKNAHTLQKFEDMIFSGLVANEEQLPKYFDGVDQISKLVQALKK